MRVAAAKSTDRFVGSAGHAWAMVKVACSRRLHCTKTIGIKALSEGFPHES
jgi:hypothetical protein